MFDLIKISAIVVVVVLNAQWVDAQTIPTGLRSEAYDSHIELFWNPNPEPNLLKYRIYASEDSTENFERIAEAGRAETSHIDFVGTPDVIKYYKISAVNSSGDEGEFSDIVADTTFAMTDDELLTMVQEYTFRYFWDFAHPVSGLARERNTTSTVTMGGSGFGVMAILVGIERGFITRQQGLERLLKIVTFLEGADRFMGVYPHWMNGATGRVVPFSPLDDGGDLVETSFLLQGLLTVREYFAGDSPEEMELRSKITGIWEAVDWNFYRDGRDVLLWHWSPQHNFAINFEIRGYFESLITYLLAVASPTNAVPASLYHDGWAGREQYTNGRSFFGFKLFVGPNAGGPLFFAHYSFLGFDPRGIKDAYANYFINNINHTLINRAYCINNGRNFVGYSDVCWGLTASDNPFGYSAHSPSNDNGTITPTAALSSMPYTPTESIAAMKHFYREHGERLWGKYGFYDAFNLTENWFARSYLAIDQGPIICMIENYRTELLWNYFMKNPEIQEALDEIGFVPDSTVVTSNQDFVLEPNALKVFPNPVHDQLTIEIEATHSGNSGVIEVLNSTGKVIWRQKSHFDLNNKLNLDCSQWPSGLYWIRLKIKSDESLRKILINH